MLRRGAAAAVGADLLSHFEFLGCSEAAAERSKTFVSPMSMISALTSVLTTSIELRRESDRAMPVT